MEQYKSGLLKHIETGCTDNEKKQYMKINNERKKGEDLDE